MKIFVSNNLGNSSFFARFSHEDMLALASPTLTRALLKPTPATIKRDNKKIMFSPAKIIKRVVPGGFSREEKKLVFFRKRKIHQRGTAEKKKNRPLHQRQSMKKKCP